MTYISILDFTEIWQFKTFLFKHSQKAKSSRVSLDTFPIIIFVILYAFFIRISLGFSLSSRRYKGDSAVQLGTHLPSSNGWLGENESAVQ